jgi:multiple sugar transport system ATP-binding protein
VFLLDEPLEHLDVTLRVATRARIKRLHAELDTTMIYVTHDQLEAISLADRIAVMNFAVLQQVGTREELLNRPKNIFVADFIGEPAINFIDAELETQNGAVSAKFKSSDTRLEIPKEWGDLLKKEGVSDIKLGIRPHDMTPEPHDGYVSMNGTVDIFEFLGEENHVTCDVGGETITMVVDSATFFEHGDKITLYVPGNRLHVFNPETEECLTTRYKSELGQ